MEKFLELVQAEMERTIELYDDRSKDPYQWLSILVEEVGEIAKGLNENSREQTKLELIQAANACLCMYNSLSRRPPEFDERSEL